MIFLKNYIVKSALDFGQLKARVDEGYNRMEIQLFDDFVDKSIEEMMFLITGISGLDIVNIHAPIGSNKFVNIEDMSNPDRAPVFNKLFELCQRVSYHYNRPTFLVMHSNYSLADFKEKNQLIDLEKSVLKLLSDFPDVVLAIENLVPIYKQDGAIREGNNYLFGTVDIVKHLRDELQTDRIFTVLDTAHAMISINYLNEIGYDKPISLIKYFKENQNYLKIIHLGNAFHLGLCKDEHGVLFSKDSPDDLSKLKEINDGILTYAKEASLVIEVTEPDYLKIEHVKKTIEALEIAKK